LIRASIAFLQDSFDPLDCRLKSGNDSTNCPTRGVPNMKASNATGTAR